MTPLLVRIVRGAVLALSPFGWQDVHLDGGPLRSRMDELRGAYLSIPNDDLLVGFRRRAGKPAPGIEPGGWYASDTFHVFGQILSGLARLGAASGDPACHEKLAALERGWADCIADDGFFYYSDHPNAPHYTFDKMVGGLVDAAQHGGCSDALEHLARITRWAEQHLSRARPFAFNAGQGDTEWYTLTENLDRAFLATGDERYRTFAEVWEYPEYWDLYRSGADLFSTGVRAYHAYSHVNTLAGAGAAYLVKGEPRYLETLVRAHERLLAEQVFATGAFGPDEQLLPAAELAARLAATHHTFETQCGTWAVFKLCKYLLELTGDARYGDWIERLVWNAVAASLPTTADGRAFYYSDYHLDGATKTCCPDAWSCCAGTAPIVAAEIVDLIWLRTDDGVLANLYLPSHVALERDGVRFELRQETRFPEADRVTFSVSAPQPVRFALELRAPAWLSAPVEARLNGAPAVLASDDAHHRLRLRREWHDGDRLTIRLPMALAAVPFLAGHAHPAALTLGPVVLAIRATGRAPHALVDLEQPARDLLAVDGEPLTFRLRREPAALARPLYALREGEPYYVALDPARPTIVSHASIAFTGEWHDGGRFRYGNAVGNRARATFEGTGVRWLGYRFDDAGRAAVAIDGKQVATVDQYGPGRDLPFDWRWTGLSPGRHTIEITLLDEKAAASRDRFLNLAGFQIDP